MYSVIFEICINKTHNDVKVNYQKDKRNDKNDNKNVSSRFDISQRLTITFFCFYTKRLSRVITCTYNFPFIKFWRAGILGMHGGR